MARLRRGRRVPTNPRLGPQPRRGEASLPARDRAGRKDRARDRQLTAALPLRDVRRGRRRRRKGGHVRARQRRSSRPVSPTRSSSSTSAHALWFSAGSLLDKYGPDDRYDFYRHLPSIELPLLLTLGGLEDGLGFAPLAVDGPALADKQANLTYASIEGADHSYLARVPEVWSLTREWLLA